MRKIKVVVVGVGAMGRGIVQVVEKHDDMEIVGIADISPAALQRTKQFLPKHCMITTRSIDLLKTKPDVLVEASTSIVDAVFLIKQTLEQKIHVVLMNSEVDQVYGRLFARWADENGVIVTSDAGDQYGVLIRVIDDMKSMGFELVMAGNDKGYLNRYANPTIQKPFAKKFRLNLKPCTAYTDGTKLAIEMALTANALDLKLLQKGMVGPKANHVNDALQLFDLDRARKLGGVVDYVLGADPSGSVFVIGYSDNPEDNFFMSYYKMGEGPYYVFLRPYHLCHYETPYAIRKIMVEQKPVLVQKRRSLEVGSYAKINLKAGTKLDGIGGYHLYGLLQHDKSLLLPTLPIALSEGVTLRYNKKKDEEIRLNEVRFPKWDKRLELWREQGEN